MSYLPQPENDFVCSEPLVETKEFSKQDMKKAYYMFILQTAHHRLKIAKLHKILPIVIEHGLYWDFFYWLPRGIIKDLKRFGNLSQTAIRVFKEEGFLKLLKRIKTRNK
jgi:hypothetical protein